MGYPYARVQEASQHVADSNEGMLWRPIKKLMNRAQGLRQAYLESHSARADLSAKMADWNASDQGNHRADTGDPMFGMIENVQEAVEGVTPPMEGLQLAPSISGSAPFDWDPWLAAASTSMESSIRSQYNDDMNQMAWTNWENFINGVQGQEEVVIPGSSDKAPGYSSLWL